VISASIKNQWGVIQQPELRLKLHPRFKEVIYHVNRALPRSLAVVDGKYGLTQNGPLRGHAIEPNWIAIGESLFTMDYLVARLMGFDPGKIGYLRWIFHRENILSLDNVTFNTDYRRFVSDGFYLQRQWTDLPGRLSFNSRALAYLGYESALARPLHWLLYRFREPFY
jgi:hypothetical protein